MLQKDAEAAEAVEAFEIQFTDEQDLQVGMGTFLLPRESLQGSCSVCALRA